MALAAVVALFVAAQSGVYSLFPIGGGEFHAMFAYSEGNIRAAVWAFAGFIGTMALGGALLVWLGYPVRWWALATACTPVGVWYWWHVYSWQPQSARFHALVGALFPAIPLVLFAALWVASHLRTQRSDLVSRWVLHNLVLLVFVVPLAMGLLEWLAFNALQPGKARYNLVDLVESLLLTESILFLPLLVGGMLQLGAVWVAMRRFSGLPAHLVFAATLPLLLAMLVTIPGIPLLLLFPDPRVGLAGALAIAGYLWFATPPPISAHAHGAGAADGSGSA